MDYLENVVPCELCGERWCLLCGTHWAFCECPGPHDEEVPEVPEMPEATPKAAAPPRQLQ
jgi:hypothetical protein